jgi:hypothetical protein
MITLRLEVPYFEDAQHWHWQLLPSDEDADNSYLGYDEISLDPPDADAGGGTAPSGTSDWLWRSVADAPDRSAAMTEARRWLGEHLLPTVGRAIAKEAPAIVRVCIPLEAVALLDYPLELASIADPAADGGFLDLAENDVTFVYEVVGSKSGTGKKDPAKDKLRVLAIFSEPAQATLPTLYVEQRRLAFQIDRIASQQRKSIELRILPHGTTRDRLRDCLEEGEGWDIIHVSGYGVTKGLALWGSEPLPIAQLAKDLKRIRHRLKVITLIDREPPEPAWQNGAGQRVTFVPYPPAVGDHAVTAVASALADTLGCAVLAFRYPACEPFALTFTLTLFDYLLGKKEQGLPGAIQLANKATSDQMGDVQGWCCQPGPMLFGFRPKDPSLVPPQLGQRPTYDVHQFKMTGFPQEELANSQTPIALRARADNALSEGSEHRGVVLLGSAKRTRLCALELAYGHRDDFEALVWHQGPTTQAEVPGSFNDLIRSLDRKLPGLRMAEQVDTPQDLRDFMPKLTGLLEAKLVLVMIADVDLLLAAQGNWMNPSWRLAIEAMSAHTGGSRLIVTSGHAPAAADVRMELLPVAPESTGADPTSGDHGDLPGVGRS